MEIHPSPLAQQLAYYRARAEEYDQWWLRTGRYDRGETLNTAWFTETTQLADALTSFRPHGRILELAGGTGIWSERLLPFASGGLTIVDGSPEMLAINSARLSCPSVRYIEADLFQWEPKPERQYDLVFFSFWLSHIPPEIFESFWSKVARCLTPGGRVFFIDSRRDPTSTAINHHLPDNEEATLLTRKLDDGREFQIVKVFHDPEELTHRLKALGWTFQIDSTRRYFLHGGGRLNT